MQVENFQNNNEMQDEVIPNEYFSINLEDQVLNNMVAPFSLDTLIIQATFVCHIIPLYFSLDLFFH
jgi:hypothetical protein